MGFVSQQISSRPKLLVRISASLEVWERGCKFPPGHGRAGARYPREEWGPGWARLCPGLSVGQADGQPLRQAQGMCGVGQKHAAKRQAQIWKLLVELDLVILNSVYLILKILCWKRGESLPLILACLLVFCEAAQIVEEQRNKCHFGFN